MRLRNFLCAVKMLPKGRSGCSHVAGLLAAGLAMVVAMTVAPDEIRAQDWCAKFKIKIPAEATICGTPALIAKDRDMVALFKQLGGWSNQPLKVEQNAFIAARNDCNTDATCLGLRYDTRIAQLKAMLGPVATPAPTPPTNECTAKCLSENPNDPELFEHCVKLEQCPVTAATPAPPNTCAAQCRTENPTDNDLYEHCLKLEQCAIPISAPALSPCAMQCRSDHPTDNELYEHCLKLAVCTP